MTRWQDRNTLDREQLGHGGQQWPILPQKTFLGNVGISNIIAELQTTVKF